MVRVFAVLIRKFWGDECAPLLAVVFSYTQFIKQQAMYDDMEATLADKIEEHEVFEAQFTTEHEEEVRALRQQKQCLVKELKDLKDHYESIFDNQEQEVTMMTVFFLVVVVVVVVLIICI